MRRSSLLSAGLLLLWSAGARAQTRIDGIEHLFGASNTNAVAGHGALTAGISADGDLTVLSWPSPSYYDQLAYIASNDLDVRSEPHLGALDGMGSYIGLIVDDGTGPALSWLRDAKWTHTQGYTRDDAPVPVTTFTRSDLGLTVTLTDIVSPDADVLTRDVKVGKSATSTVTSVSLAVYENLSPTLSQIEQLPVADWALDSRNDFFALYDKQSGQIIHFHPDDRAVINALLGATLDLSKVDYGPMEALMKSTPSDAEVDAQIASLDSDEKPGVAAIITTEPAPSQFQVGSDATKICTQVNHLVDNILKLPQVFPGAVLPIDPSVANALKCTDQLAKIRSARGWSLQPQDALSDLADRTLSGSRVAAGQTNGALIAPLTFQGATAEGSVDFAFGSTLAEARKALSTAEQNPPMARQKAAEDAADAVLGKARLPDKSLGTQVVRIAERALVNVYVARDRKTGAICASIARQPPYYLDWPRDGAFFDAALDVAGLDDWVTQRTEWYAGLLRAAPTRGNLLLTPNVPTDPTTGEQKFPGDAWEMNYFADGTTGGPIRFEIDNTGLHIWSLALHAATLDASARKAYVDKIWPSAKRALDLLDRWTLKGSALPAPANEDDHTELTSELQGAIAVYSAMAAGSRLAKLEGDSADYKRYQKHAAALGDAIMKTYYLPDQQRFRDLKADKNPSAGKGTVAWTIWPGRLLAADDPRLEVQLDADMDAIIAKLSGKDGEGASYTAKNIVSAALYGKPGGSHDKAKQALDLLANVATPDTLQFGEAQVITSKPGQPLTWSNRVAPPHVWQGILFYLSAMALSQPDLFDKDRTTWPLPTDGTAGQSTTVEAAGGGCGCHMASGNAPLDGATLALFGLVALGWRRRQRSA
jgi:MYXO-CTERM domain-containing protein